MKIGKHSICYLISIRVHEFDSKVLVKISCQNIVFLMLRLLAFASDCYCLCGLLHLLTLTVTCISLKSEVCEIIETFTSLA